MGGSTVVMCVPSGRPAQQMAGVPRCTVLVGNYYIAFSIHYGGKWGPLSHCCFNGPTSRNVAGIYWLSDVYCYSFTLGIVVVSPLSILGVPHRLAGAQQ